MAAGENLCPQVNPETPKGQLSETRRWDAAGALPPCSDSRCVLAACWGPGGAGGIREELGFQKSISADFHVIGLSVRSYLGGKKVTWLYF